MIPTTTTTTTTPTTNYHHYCATSLPSDAQIPYLPTLLDPTFTLQLAKSPGAISYIHKVPTLIITLQFISSHYSLHSSHIIAPFTSSFLWNRYDIFNSIRRFCIVGTCLHLNIRPPSPPPFPPPPNHACIPRSPHLPIPRPTY